MEENIKILKQMRDDTYGAMQFEDDYEVYNYEEKQFNALNSAIKALTELEKKDKIIDLMADTINRYANLYEVIKCPAEYEGTYLSSNCIKEQPTKENCRECIKQYFESILKSEVENERD